MAKNLALEQEEQVEQDLKQGSFIEGEEDQYS
jgi:hypothetical protein